MPFSLALLFHRYLTMNVQCRDVPCTSILLYDNAQSNHHSISVSAIMLLLCSTLAIYSFLLHSLYYVYSAAMYSRLPCTRHYNIVSSMYSLLSCPLFCCVYFYYVVSTMTCYLPLSCTRCTFLLHSLYYVPSSTT
jgi:hypothetical protein